MHEAQHGYRLKAYLSRLSPYIPRSPKTSRWYWLRVREFASMVKQYVRFDLLFRPGLDQIF